MTTNAKKKKMEQLGMDSSTASHNFASWFYFPWFSKPPEMFVLEVKQK